MHHDKWKLRIGGVLLILVGLWNVFGFVMTIEFAKFYLNIIDIENIIITIFMLYLGYILIRYS
ncbi:hypothetical protein PGH24_11960 [Thermoanaerobacterium thermosaccharolyticum]|uniref:Uncharacterized protein n=1 Tax=Thermoanaerobacterium thermosaccharolyticum TaxID=1517 RepID=A0A231VKB9_THETR|nr:hypothetical protein [Thermoanaerobacterium thermosaccharolyticum]OXT08574.1 hypothetical protein CE561_04570 [Thermoanaerobacterium thermosaccharolyticum]WHE06838.1 hypothetical protein PGH24_11960 [Thermoanaerobacterium thermosaccharolyticum]